MVADLGLTTRMSRAPCPPLVLTNETRSPRLGPCDPSVPDMAPLPWRAMAPFLYGTWVRRAPLAVAFSFVGSVALSPDSFESFGGPSAPSSASAVGGDASGAASVVFSFLETARRGQKLLAGSINNKIEPSSLTLDPEGAFIFLSSDPTLPHLPPLLLSDPVEPCDERRDGVFDSVVWDGSMRTIPVHAFLSALVAMFNVPRGTT
mmetsp:Transcript_20292/g.22739  ORF Transcript_20292/g.22739 Transcript_20292/m.22739 type:complete len:205 (+) Transcript_20292:1049-1663(+)